MGIKALRKNWFSIFTTGTSLDGDATTMLKGIPILFFLISALRFLLTDAFGMDMIAETLDLQITLITGTEKEKRISNMMLLLRSHFRIVGGLSSAYGNANSKRRIKKTLDEKLAPLLFWTIKILTAYPVNIIAPAVSEDTRNSLKKPPEIMPLYRKRSRRPWCSRAKSHQIPILNLLIIHRKIKLFKGWVQIPFWVWTLNR